MPASAARILLAALLLAPAAARAEPAKLAAPTAPPHAQPPTPPAAHSPPRPAARRDAPLIKPRPAAPPRHPAQPAKPPVPAAVPAPEPEKPAEPQKGSNTGMPLPRFAALRSNEVNFRSGPGTRYPIEWVYKRTDLPVQIEREFENWRLVRDQEGVKGWVIQATLAPRRTAIVIGAPNGPEQALRRDARDDASPVARLKPGVIVRLRACEATSPWCQAQVGDYRGWMKRTDLWGVSPDEAIQ
jgi:SH3-like domain-containing protein